MKTARSTSSLEPLESRIAPAALLNHRTVTFQDMDGDTVTVKVSKAVLHEDTINDVFKFSSGLVDGSSATPQQLQLIDLTALAALGTASGIEISVSAKRSVALGGDGFVNVGRINATGIDLGAVYVGGDLGQIDAGDATTARGFGLRSIVAQSMGEFGTSTQAPGGDLVSSITGALGKLIVKGNVREAQIEVNAASVVDAKIGRLAIGGSLIGGIAENSGSIQATGPIGHVSVGGSLFGGAGNHSGTLFSETEFGAVNIRHDIVGGAGADSGGIQAGISDNFPSLKGNLSKLNVGGSVITGTGSGSAKIALISSGPITIKGDLGGTISGESIPFVTIAGSVTTTGNISIEGSLAPDVVKISITGDLRGNVLASGGDVSVAVGGSVIGSGEVGTGSISVSSFNGSGVLTIGHDIVGGSAESSGWISCMGVSRISVGGSIIGGSGDESASVFAIDKEMAGAVTVGGNVRGGSGYYSGSITGAFQRSLIAIGGSLVGGGGELSGLVTDNGGSNFASRLSAIKVGGDVRGGSGESSGSISSGGAVSTLSIGQSLIGGGGAYSASLFDIGIVSIFGSIRGGIGDNSARIDYYSDHDAPSLVVGGSIVSGTGKLSAAITSEFSLRNISIRGDVVGSAAQSVVISAFGDIGKATIGGNVVFLVIDSGGYPGAQIGTVTVGGDWVASSIAAGVASTNGFFGDGDDTTVGGSTTVVSRIASITIKGRAFGTVGGSDHFGFVAQEIGSLRIGGVVFPLTKGAANDDLDANDPLLLIGSTNDMRVHEIAL